MQDLISRQAAIDAAIEAADEWDGGCNPEREKAIRTAIMALPTVDAVPVVRCKECKYGEQDDYGWICTNIDGGIMGDENGNGFCCEGERREE